MEFYWDYEAYSRFNYWFALVLYVLSLSMRDDADDVALKQRTLRKACSLGWYGIRY